MIVHRTEAWWMKMARREAGQFKLTMPEPLELDLHRQIADALTMEIAPARHISRHAVVWWSSDISNSAMANPGARLAQGIGGGIPDLMFLYRGDIYFQEIKRLRAGTLSDMQAEFMAAARLAGAPSAICWDSESCLRNLDIWQIPRHRRLIFPLKIEEGVNA
jgi:hypothetical protein